MCGGASTWAVAAAIVWRGAGRRASLQRRAPRLRRRSSCRRLWKRQLPERAGRVDGSASGRARRIGLWNHRGGDRRRDGADRPRRRSEDGRGGASRVEGRHVIGPTGAVRVLVATKPVDFRKGAEGLAALVRETDAGRSVLGRRLCVPGETGGPGEADLTGTAPACACSPSGSRMASSAGRACRMA